MEDINTGSVENEQVNEPTQQNRAKQHTSFSGMHFPGAVTRVISTPDPANPSRTVSVRKKLDLITGLVLQRAYKPGKFENTGEEYITVSGQYAPGKTARITVSAQNVLPVAEALLKGNVDKTNPDNMLLINQHVVEVVGTPMRHFGFLVEELYLVNNDGSKTVVLGASTQVEATESVDSLFL